MQLRLVDELPGPLVSVQTERGLVLPVLPLVDVAAAHPEVADLVAAVLRRRTEI